MMSATQLADFENAIQYLETARDLLEGYQDCNDSERGIAELPNTAMQVCMLITEAIERLEG